MVSRRKYFSMAIVMFVMFFMFQFTNTALDQINEFEDNPYAQDQPVISGEEGDFDNQNGEMQTAVNHNGSITKDSIVYIGRLKESIGRMVQTWAAYTKRDINMYLSLTQFENDREKSGSDYPEMILMDSANVNWKQQTEISQIEKYVAGGVNIVFCNLPDTAVIEQSPSIRRILGIEKVEAESTTVTGIHLYKNFLLGGETIYKADDKEEEKKKQDMDLTFPWFKLASGTKIYMNGILKDKPVDLTDNPVIIWRKSFENAFVFAVNGTYMEDAAGLGILSAMSADMHDYELYPIVNAQNLVVANYPSFASENTAVIKERYAQSMKGVFKNIVWPNIVSVYQNNKLGLSCMLAPQFNYQDKNEPEKDEFIYYMRRLNEQNAEAGLSGFRVSDTPIDEKIAEDDKFIQSVLSDHYEFTSFYGGNLPEYELKSAVENRLLESVRTVVKKYEGDSEIFGYLTTNVTKQSTVTDGLKHTYFNDFRVKSIETALGYTSVLIDMEDVAYPKDNGSDTWKDLAEDLEWDIDYYWKEFRLFTGTTVTECDERIRNFLDLDYQSYREINKIYLELDRSESSAAAWFLLRIDNKIIDGVEGGSWEYVEDNIYLIEVNEQNAVITLKPSDKFQYKF